MQSFKLDNRNGRKIAINGHGSSKCRKQPSPLGLGNKERRLKLLHLGCSEEKLRSVEKQTRSKDGSLREREESSSGSSEIP